MKQQLLAIFLSVTLISVGSGCSVVRNTGLGVFGDILSKAAPEIQKEKSWEFFREAVASQLMLISTLGTLKKDDKRFLFTTIQGHAAYAFSVWDTLYLEDYINLEDESEFKSRAIYHYSRAVEAGEWYLSMHDLSIGDLIKSKNPRKLLDENLDDDEIDQKIVLFIGQSLGGLINMQKDQSNLLTALPVVKAMFDWTCEANPNLYDGTCPIFYGAYEAGRPKMLGGNPEKGREIFLGAIKKYPDNLLVRMALIQYYLIPKGDEPGFLEQMAIIEEKMRDFNRSKYWSPFSNEDDSKEKMRAKLNLFNATAIKRYEVLSKNQSEIF